MEMIARACPLCGSHDESQVFAGAQFDLAQLDEYAFASRKMPEYMHYRLVACPVCDLLYASPAPKKDSLSTAYQEAAFDSAEEAHFASRTYGRFLKTIARALPDRQGLLDIGTGDGAFLAEAQAAGFACVQGVEPSAAPIAAARPEIRRLIRPDIFRPEQFTAGRLSLITCFQTIEHLDNPLEMCRQAGQLLKPGGALFLVGHNRRAVSAKLLGKKSPIFDIEHLQLFSPRSARNLLARAGFERIRVQPVLNRYPLHYWLKLFPLPTPVKRRLIPALKRVKIGYLPIPLPAGNLAVVGYKPRTDSLEGGANPNVAVFDRDAATGGGYVYTTNTRLSSRLATRRSTRAILATNRFAGRSVIDMGCGDGFYTIRFWDKGRPRAMTGVDGAAEAIAVARANKKDRPITFEVADAHAVPYPDNSFDLALVQSILHHDDQPADIIREALRLAPEILIHEPNGNNLGLKIIERTSLYHREHNEKSYSSRQMARWIREAGGEVVYQRFAGFVPMFCPAWLARLMKMVEPVVETVPGLNALAGSVYVMVARRR
jgi:SAM-dependent methyltransferase